MSRTATITRRSERFTNGQSEKTILEIILMSISCIFFLRGFFNESHFTDDIFQINQSTDKTKKPSKTKSKSKDHIKVKKLKPGVSDDTDRIIHWINVSIFDSLKKKYLKSISLSIILDNNKPLEVFESYVFNIVYNEINFSESICLNNEVIISPGEITKLQIFKLLKKIILLTQALPSLPSKRFLQMRLLFNDNCPNDYYLEHFMDCSDEKSAIMKIPLPVYDDLVANCGDVNSVHHNISTSLISLSTLSPSDFKNCKIVEIDPFNIFDTNSADKSNSVDNHNNANDIQARETEPININTQVSQVTKELYDMLTNFNNENHDGETQVYNSLKETNEVVIECSCRSNLYLPYSSLIQCQICEKNMHKVCYCINSNTQDFICLDCSGSLKSITLNDFLILSNIRKLITYYTSNNKNYVDSFTSAASILGFSKTIIEKDKTIIKTIIDAFSVLFFEGLFTYRTNKSFSYRVFMVDFDGLVINNKAIKKGKFYISFNHSNTNHHIVDKLMNPNFGQNHELNDSLSLITDVNDMFDETIVENVENEKIKKRKVSKSVDIFKI